ncbi:hypothetical protein Scep_026426 [Stephania cephalantha]|uniref:Uncharacterized protein n=1 Tax=Stephania cephalantha TaxID=152367 RepID=A0AAP0ENA5_9MAGN
MLCFSFLFFIWTLTNMGRTEQIFSSRVDIFLWSMSYSPLCSICNNTLLSIWTLSRRKLKISSKLHFHIGYVLTWKN